MRVEQAAIKMACRGGLRYKELHQKLQFRT
jgi:hypothetical protein